ncbi:MAG: hypothetical protein ACR2FV_08180 [Ornithinimicrobium sp.]|uniref:hypothetical protein n=1 Tax=Ornithinimicrobium sp. TaxID=1977084 RepID=UPI003D9AED68
MIKAALAPVNIPHSCEHLCSCCLQPDAKLRRRSASELCLCLVEDGYGICRPAELHQRIGGLTEGERQQEGILGFPGCLRAAAEVAPGFVSTVGIQSQPAHQR